jgi:hypothetical protein
VSYALAALLILGLPMLVLVPLAVWYVGVLIFGIAHEIVKDLEKHA